MKNNKTAKFRSASRIQCNDITPCELPYSFLDTGSDKLWLYGKTLVAESINAV